jgi:transposase-like protein
MEKTKRYTEAERKNLISQFHRSHLSASAFCRARGISTVSLALWRKRYAAHSPHLSRHAQATDGAAPAWVPVLVRDEEMTCPPPLAAAYVLATNTGRLEVPRGFDAREVAALWQVLSAAAPLTEWEVAS